MIVKNEEHCIERSLQSIKALADEIIIVDTGSTDETISIAQRFTDKIFPFTWVDDFSAARNFALSMATKEWILILDADEMLAEEDLQKIRKLVSKDAVAYFLHQKEYTNNTTLTGFTYSTNKDAYSKGYLGYIIVENAIRLFRRESWIHFSWKIHESVAPALEEKKYAPADSGVFIHHYKQEKGDDIQQHKMLKYLAIGKKQIKETPLLAKPYYEVGLIYYALGRYSDAITAFQKMIALAPQEYRAYYKLGRSFLKAGNIDAAINAFQKYLSFDTKNSDVCGELGLLMIKQKQFHEAEQWLRTALEINPGNILARHNLGILLLQTNHKEQALALLQETEKTFPNPFVYNTLGVLHASEKKYVEAQCYFEKGLLCSSTASEITKSLHMNLTKTLIFLKKEKEEKK